MKKLTALILVVSSVWSGSGFGWGEAGHHLIARSAARLAEKHPALKEVKDVEARRALDQFLKVLRDRHYQQGHLANIPDVYWRNLEDGLAQAGNQLGSPTHYLNAEYLAPEGAKDPYLESKVPLDYEAARSYVSGLYPSISLFKTVGTAPWRAQQFATLMKSALEATPKAACETYENKEAPPTRAMLTFAGILAHYTGDSAQPLHSTKDFDAVATGQKGLHWYFENDLVNALEPALEAKVEALAEKILTGVEKQKGTLAALWKKTNERFPDLKPDQRTQALVFMELADSYGALKKLRDLDLKYAVSTAEEALALETCRPTVSALMGELEKTPSKVKRRELLRQKAIGSKEPEQAACRRTPTALVDWSGARCKTADAGAGCKTVAQWHESLIVERLALATAVTADVLVRAWKDGGMVSPCWSWQYAMKPGFVSPTDGSCFGYARSERAEDVLTSTKPMPSIWKTNSKTAIDCARF